MSAAVYGLLNGLFAMPDEPGDEWTPTVDEALQHALAAQRITRLMIAGMMDPEERTDSDDELLLHVSWYGPAWIDWARRLVAESSTTATLAVHPPLGEPVTHGERVADCPVCGAAIMGQDEKNGWEAGTCHCDRCDAVMHEPCYWGRVGTLAEFQEYRRQVAGGDENYAPEIVCAQCRAKEA